MQENFCYINYYQGMALFKAIEEFKKKNQYFNDGIARSFEIEFLSQTEEKALKPIQSKNYKFSKSMIDYLIRLTSINIYDKKYMKYFIKEQQKIEKELIKNFKKSEMLTRKIK